MNNYLEKILALVTDKPDLRAVQISDKLGIDPEVVENILAQGVKDGNLIATPVLGPNKLQANSYKANPLLLGWVAKKGREPAAVEEKAAVAGTYGKKKTTTEKAIEFLTGKKWVVADALAKAMDLPHDKCSPQSYLGKAIGNGVIVKNGTWYCLASEAGVPPPNMNATTTAVQATQEGSTSQTHTQSGSFELIAMLRAGLTPDEFRGFLKGIVIEQVMYGDSQGGSRPYGKAAEYAKFLADGDAERSAKSQVCNQ